MPRRLLLLLLVLVLLGGAAFWVYGRRPEDPGERHYRLGLQAVKEGRGQDAAQEFQVAVSLNPAHTRARLEVAGAHLNGGSVALAIREFREVLKRSPRVPHGYCRLAEAYQRGDLEDLARKTATVATREEKKCPRAYRVLGTLLVDAQAFSEARAALEQAHKLEPQDAGTLAVLARLHMQLDRLPEAEQAARKLLALDPTHPQGAFILGHCLMARRDPAVREEAIGHLKTAVQSDPNMNEARIELARAYRASDRLLAARWELEQVVRSAPSERAALQQLAEVLTDLGDLKRAQQVRRQVENAAAEAQRRLELERRIASAPTDGTALLALGGIYARSREYLRAIETLERAGEVLGPRPDQQALLAQVRKQAASSGP